MTVNREKVGNIGYFATPKPMVFDRDVSSLIPEGDEKQKKLIDYSVVKKGLKAGSRKTKKQDDLIEAAYLEEEERIAEEEKEQARLAKIAESQGKNVQEEAEQARKDALKGIEKKKEEHVEGKLRMQDCGNLPEDIEDILHHLEKIDFELQDLDILIELSRNLKNRRLKLFPDRDIGEWMQELQNAG